MAFASFSPSDLDELLSQLNTFASTKLGWSATWGGGELALTPKTGEAVFRLSAEANSYQDSGAPQLVLTTEETIGGTLESFTTVMSHVYSTAVCWFFGGAEPEPWLHIVVQVSPGTYRHAYLGYLERYGAWTGGAVCDANQLGRDGGSDPNDYEDWINYRSHALFSLGSRWERDRPSGRLGGVLVQGHGATGQSPVARFAENGSSNPGYDAAPLDAPVVGGGFKENRAWALCNPGVAPFSGEAALAPITLFADITRNGNWAPLGRVCGIRMVNVDDFSPEQEISYAGRTWRIFPLVRKPPSTEYEPHSGNRGVAVLQEEA